MSTRAIASGIGVDQATVRRDLPGEADASPAVVTGTDGKTYSAPRTPQQPRRRRPLPDAYREAVDELQRSALRIARLHGDDRFAANRETVRNNRAELMRIAGIVADALMDLGDGQ